MKKIIILISILALSTGIVFAQSLVPTMPDSVRKQGTAGLYGSDSDDVSADSVYDLDRSFLSAGHSFNHQPTMSLVSFGVAINPTMFFGVTAGFDINAKYETVPTVGIPLSGLLTTTKTYNENSDFVVTAAFGLNKTMGFHYTIARGGNFTKTDTFVQSIIGTDYETITNKKNSNSEWKHEIAFAMMIGNGMKFNIPLGVILDNNKDITAYTNKKGAITEDGLTTVATATGPGSKVNVYLNPDFSMPLDLGAFNKIKVGAGVNVAVYNETGMYEQTTNRFDPSTGFTTEGTTMQAKNEGAMDITWEIYATPTFEWNLLEEQLSFMIEPTIGFKMTIENTGQEQDSVTTTSTDAAGNEITTVAPITASTTEMIMTPSIDIPVAVVYSPIEWLEIRTGLQYHLEWAITDINTDNSVLPSGGNSYTESKTAATSTVQVFATLKLKKHMTSLLILLFSLCQMHSV